MGIRRETIWKNELKAGYDPYHWSVFSVASGDGNKKGDNNYGGMNSKMNIIHTTGMPSLLHQGMGIRRETVWRINFEMDISLGCIRGWK